MTTEKGHLVWLVTRYREARKILIDTRFSSDSRLPGYPVNRVFSTLIRMDPPDHTHYRQLLNPEFTVRRLSGLRPQVQKLTDDLLNTIAARAQPVDLVAELAMPLPSMVICGLLGVPPEDHSFLRERTAVALSMTSTDEQIERALTDLGDHVEQVLAERMERPADDLLTRLAGRFKAGDCPYAAAVDLARLLLVAGHVTTVNMIGLGLLTLLHDPRQADDLRADNGLIPSAVDELLRYLSVVPTLARVATEDIEVCGKRIQAGEGVLILLSVANRDLDEFREADLLDLHRDERHHLAFGAGPHQCIGKSLARMELEIVIETVLRRFPSARLAVPFDELSFRHDSNIFGVNELPVSL